MNGSPRITRLDEDTTMVTVEGAFPPDCDELTRALRKAECLGTPGLVIDLSELPHAGPDLVARVKEFQEHCIDCGRWLLVVPPREAVA